MTRTLLPMHPSRRQAFCTLLLPTILVSVLTLAGCALERPLPRETPAPATQSPTPTTAPPTAEALVPSPPPPPTATSEVLAVPTTEAPAREVKLEPGPDDVIWWGSNDGTRNHIGDSFLYAGFSEGSAFLSAVGFDLTRLERGAPIASGTLEMVGLRDDRLAPASGGSWSVQLVATDSLEDFRTADFQAIANAPAAATLVPTLFPADLAAGKANTWQLDPSALQWLEQQVLDGAGEVWVRIVGPTGGDDTLFAWNSGFGPESSGPRPWLRLGTDALLGTPPPLATEPIVIGTSPVQPRNVYTAAADALTATAVATAVGTPTLSPRYATATPISQNVATAQALASLLGERPIVAETPPPANAATATAESAYATAVAIATGTYTPTPANAVTPFIVIPTPQPANVATAAAQMLTAVARDRTGGAPSPLPFNAVLATLTPEQLVATLTPRPANAATARALSEYATAVAITTGTFTPSADRIITPTFTPIATAVPLVVYSNINVPTATPIPNAAPSQLTGKILFISDRPNPEGLPSSSVWTYDPRTGQFGFVTQAWVHSRAEAADRSAVTAEGGLSLSVEADANGDYQVYLINNKTNNREQMTSFKADSYDASWRPGAGQFAFVSQESGNDEIYTMSRSGEDLSRLTRNQWEWDKHPSYSPDGTQIVFSSNRGTGRRQIWIMGADGSNQRLLFSSPFEDYSPVWVK